LIVATVAVGGISVTASAQPASTAIGPNQSFIATVNGKHPTATITVACPGPVRPPPFAQGGHPIVNQTLGVLPARATTTSTGFTGSRGKSITVTFVLPVDSPAIPVTFTHYGTQPIPTSLLLPCSGSAPVVFTPQPTRKTARSASVMVTYENIAVTPTPTSRSATPTHTITVTWADHGRSYSVHKGDRLDVELSGALSGFTWTEPNSSNSPVVRRTSGSSGQAEFVAIGPGKATLTAVGNPKCYPQCMIASFSFEVKVRVTG
jgi:hypothetical protein